MVDKVIKEGEIINKWKILSKDTNNKNNYICQCQCEYQIIKSVDKYNIINGKSKSCGKCNQKKQNGLSNHRIYRILTHMKNRCYNQNDNKYSLYGGKGIRICDEWLNKDNGFMNFYNWSINNGYTDDLTIDRIDSNGNYEPSNCRWATFEVQNNNTSRNRMVTINGISKTMTQWCHEYNFDENLLYTRLKRGLSGEDLLIPPNVKKHDNLLLFRNNKFVEKFTSQRKVAKYLNKSQGWVYEIINKKIKSEYSIIREKELNSIENN